MIEHGQGTPIVVIPGLPGPWRFVAPAVHALARHYRVLTMSLGPECTLDSDADRIIAALDERRIARAVVCGISLGGLIALRCAARYPDRISVLVLASTPGPGATIKPRHRFYMKWPWLFGPLFVLETPFHVRHELHWSQLKALIGRPVSFGKIARRAALIESTDIAADCARVKAPTLILTGERAFDHVVPIDSTLGYLKLIQGAAHVTLRNTGHLGTVTKPELFRAAMQGYIDTLLPEVA